MDLFEGNGIMLVWRDLMRGGMSVCGEGNALFYLFAGVNEEWEWKSPFLNQSQIRFRILGTVGQLNLCVS